MNKTLLLVIIVLILLIFPVYSIIKKRSTPAVVNPSPSITNNVTQIPNTLDFPINQFKDRITKKPFGIYITPQNSPVQPERFSGYHTGADVEYKDITDDVPVFAVNDGTITLARTASGYGGVMILETEINGQLHSILYGHIRPSSLPTVGQTFKKGDQIGTLGTGYSTETDGERRHLHFAVLSDNRLDIKGYVPTQADLSAWLDPLSLSVEKNS